MTVPTGMVVPLRRGAAFDAWLPADERAALAPASPPTTTSDVDAVRANGYFVIDEMYPNAIAAGAPVFDRRGAPIATITIVAPKARVSKAAARKLGELAARTAALVTQATAGLRA